MATAVVCAPVPSPRRKTTGAVGGCDRRAHVSCIPSSEEEDNLQDHWELHTSAELSSFAEASPRPSEASSSSSAHLF
ncbi:hypothetical protein MRX96_031429 [Rhipicephalus microplus]